MKNKKHIVNQKERPTPDARPSMRDARCPTPDARLSTPYILIILAMMLVVPAHANAQSESTMIGDRPLVLLMVLAGLSLAPFVVMMMTSFVKISVVLSILRSAIGTQQIPPNQVIMGLSLVLTMYIMMPVGIEIKNVTREVALQKTGKPILSTASAEVLIEAVKAAREPVRKFLSKNAHNKDKDLFYKLALQINKKSSEIKISKEDLMVLIPAFIISELKEAFEIGFVIFIPFLIIDMVVSNILLSMGMFMLSPTTISLPFKLLLFVLVDGWYLIARGIVLGYT